MEPDGKREIHTKTASKHANPRAIPPS